MSEVVKVLALVKYGTLAASTRQRFIQYEPYLAAAGISVEYSPLFDNAHLERLVQGRRPSPLSLGLAYSRRAFRLLGGRNYDLLWVHCEFFPYLPGLVEQLSAKIGGRPILFDFDDAIFHMYDANPAALVRRALGSKLAPLLRRASACACGNAYLRDYVAAYCENNIILPTIVDTDLYGPGSCREIAAPLTIGWIGSPSTWAYMRPLLPLLEELAAQHGIRIRAVGAGARAEAERFAGLDLIEWTEETEISDIQAMDIGIMPLPDEPWARGKSGYKLIQYMACGLPVVASPVGVNSEIVGDGVNGYLATSPEEWRRALTRLIGDPELRRRLGAAGRARAVSDYSLAIHAPRLVELLKSVTASGSHKPTPR